MTDAEAYESFHARQDDLSYKRQLFLLGAAFGNPEIAKRMSKTAFSEGLFQDTVEGLNGRSRTQGENMARLADMLGVYEFDRTKKPMDLLKLVNRHCRCDAVLQTLLRNAVGSFAKLEWVRNRSATDKRDAIAKGKLLADAINKAFGEVTLEQLNGTTDAAETGNKASQEKPNASRQ